MTAQLSTIGNETGHVILRGDKDGPNYSAAHIADTRARLRRRGCRRSSWSTPRTAIARRTTCARSTSCTTWPARSPAASPAIRGVMLESNLLAGRQDLDQQRPGALEYGLSVTDACVDLDTTEAMLAELADAARARRGRPVADAGALPAG